MEYSIITRPDQIRPTQVFIDCHSNGRIEPPRNGHLSPPPLEIAEHTMSIAHNSPDSSNPHSPSIPNCPSLPVPCCLFEQSKHSKIINLQFSAYSQAHKRLLGAKQRKAKRRATSEPHLRFRSLKNRFYLSYILSNPVPQVERIDEALIRTTDLTLNLCDEILLRILWFLSEADRRNFAICSRRNYFLYFLFTSRLTAAT